MDGALAFGIVTGGIFLAGNVCAFEFVSDTVTKGIREVEGQGWNAHWVYRKVAQPQATDYLDKSTEPIMSRIGFNFARKVYHV